MKEENYVTVERRVFSTGVGNDLDLPLRINMEKGLDQFSLDWARDYGDVKADVKFNFSKSDKGNYFFNSMDVTIDKDGEKISQKFYIDNTYDPKLREQYPDLNLNFTVKEAVNLLCGRSVRKLHATRIIKDPTREFSIENSTKLVEPAWLVIDLTDKDKYGNHKIDAFKGDHNEVFEKKLDQMQLKKYQSVDFRKSLRRGDPNIPVLFTVGDKDYKRYIEFKARYKNFKVEDSYLASKEKKGQEKELGRRDKILQLENEAKEKNAGKDIKPAQLKPAVKPKVKVPAPKRPTVTAKKGKATIPKKKVAKVGR